MPCIYKIQVKEESPCSVVRHRKLAWRGVAWRGVRWWRAFATGGLGGLAGRRAARRRITLLRATRRRTARRLVLVWWRAAGWRVAVRRWAVRWRIATLLRAVRARSSLAVGLLTALRAIVLLVHATTRWLLDIRGEWAAAVPSDQSTDDCHDDDHTNGHSNT